MSKPFLKYAGGKSSLVPTLLDLVPGGWLETKREYHEPFLGGGAFFFALRDRFRIENARLSDRNETLIEAYLGVAHAAEEVIRQIDEWPTDEKTYYWVRDELPKKDAGDLVLNAARTIYLNKTCFNGLFRFGPNGFNVPWGKRENAIVYEKANLHDVARDLISTKKIHACDFADAFVSAQTESLAYLDPPYVPKTKNSFTSYGGGSFVYRDQERLRDEVHKLAKRAWVIVSNTDSPWIREAYGDFQINFVQGRRSMSASGTSRQSVDDVIVVAGPGVKAGRRTIDAKK